jgi:hypothetical protein
LLLDFWGCLVITFVGLPYLVGLPGRGVGVSWLSGMPGDEDKSKISINGFTFFILR